MKHESGIVQQIVPALAAWGVKKLLESPQLKSSVRSIDHHIEERRHRAETAVRRAVKGAGDNAKANRVWLAAGIAAFAVGVVLIAKAAARD